MLVVKAKKVMTYDTTKAAGHKHFDIKTSHITICDSEKKETHIALGPIQMPHIVVKHQLKPSDMTYPK